MLMQYNQVLPPKQNLNARGLLMQRLYQLHVNLCTAFVNALHPIAKVTRLVIEI
jgi:hypothetical protein